MILSAYENRLRAGLVNTLYKQIQPLSRIKTLNRKRVRRISTVGEEKVYGSSFIYELEYSKIKKCGNFYACPIILELSSLV